MAWLQYQWVCDSDGTTQYRCITPSKCSTFSPDSNNSLNTDDASVDTMIWYMSATATSEENVWGYATIALAEVAMTATMNPAEKDVRDTAAWRENKPYYEGELIIETGMIFECLVPASCATTRPTSTDNASGSIWGSALDSETGETLEPPASKEVILENHVWSRNAAWDESTWEMTEIEP